MALPSHPLPFARASPPRTNVFPVQRHSNLNCLPFVWAESSCAPLAHQSPQPLTNTSSCITPVPQYLLAAALAFGTHTSMSRNDSTQRRLATVAGHVATAGNRSSTIECASTSATYASATGRPTSYAKVR